MMADPEHNMTPDSRTISKLSKESNRTAERQLALEMNAAMINPTPSPFLGQRHLQYTRNVVPQMLPYPYPHPFMRMYQAPLHRHAMMPGFPMLPSRTAAALPSSLPTASICKDESGLGILSAASQIAPQAETDDTKPSTDSSDSQKDEDQKNITSTESPQMQAINNQSSRLSEEKKTDGPVYISSPPSVAQMPSVPKPPIGIPPYMVEGKRLYIDEVQDLDVLCGRGGRSNHHVGNKRYRQVVSDTKTTYKSTEGKLKKTDLSRAIVDHVCNYGGRFIKKDEKINRYYLLTRAEARRKTSQALREHKDVKWTS